MATRNILIAFEMLTVYFIIDIYNYVTMNRKTDMIDQYEMHYRGGVTMRVEKKRMVLKGAALLTLLCLFPVWMYCLQQQEAVASPKWNRDEIEAITKWIHQWSLPLKSVTAGVGFDDLAPLKSLLTDVRIVALGEATHGSREFFQVKHRMLEFLVKEMGYTVFAIEASFPACNNINEYVLEGKGDPASALASQGFWTWDTNEVSDMITWIREYNQTAPQGKKVLFVGYDIQHLERALQEGVDYLERYDTEMVPTAKTALEPLADYEGIRELRKPENKQQLEKIRTAYEKLVAKLTFDRNRFIRLSSVREFEWVMQNIRVMGQYFSAYTADMRDIKAYEKVSRDLFMAENIAYWLRILEPGTKMVVWAHNGHVKAGKLGMLPSMGAYLREWYGDTYYALGFSFNQGGFQSCDLAAAQRTSAGCILKAFTLGPAKEGTADWFFAQAGIPNFVLDIRSASIGPVLVKWLDSPLTMRSIGSGFSMEMQDRFLDRTFLKREYDGMIFIDSTTRARPNPSGMRPKKLK